MLESKNSRQNDLLLATIEQRNRKYYHDPPFISCFPHEVSVTSGPVSLRNVFRIEERLATQEMKIGIEAHDL
jgi:hypothetical protein